MCRFYRLQCKYCYIFDAMNEKLQKLSKTNYENRNFKSTLTNFLFTISQTKHQNISLYNVLLGSALCSGLSSTLRCCLSLLLRPLSHILFLILRFEPLITGYINLSMCLLLIFFSYSDTVCCFSNLATLFTL